MYCAVPDYTVHTAHFERYDSPSGHYKTFKEEVSHDDLLNTLGQ